jgi:hypothetical protein
LRLFGFGWAHVLAKGVYEVIVSKESLEEAIELLRTIWFKLLDLGLIYLQN